MRSSRGKRASAVATAIVMGSVVLAGCADDGGSKSAGPESAGSTAATSPRASASAEAGGAADEEGTAAVRAAYGKTAEAGTAQVALQVKAGADGGSVSLAGEGAVDLAGGESTMKISAAGQSIEQRVLDQVLYQKVPGGQTSGGKEWTKIDLERVAGQLGGNPQQIVDPAQSAAYAKAITDEDVSEVGEGKVGGVDTTQYKVSVDVAKLPGGDRLSEQLGATLPMRVWLDDDGLIRRQLIEMTAKTPASAGSGGSAAPQQVTVSTSMEFSDFGTEVDVQAPPATQVTDMTDKVLRGTDQQTGQ